MLAVVRNGRHRYFRLASPAVADMIDGIVAVALQKRPRYRPLSVKHARLVRRRICYDHLAGRLSVDLTDSFIAREYVVPDDDEAAEITTAGIRFFTQLGIELPPRRSTRRHFCRLCLDWTERRPHIAGAIGAALTKRYFDLGWMERTKAQPRRRRHLVRTAGLPEDPRRRRVRARRPEEPLAGRFDHRRSVHRRVRPFRM